MLLDQANQALPLYHLIHLDQEQLFAALLMLADATTKVNKLDIEQLPYCHS